MTAVLWTSLCSVDKPVCRRCTTCGPAACWSPQSFPLTLACLEQTPRCRHMADTPGAHCCGTGGIRHYMTGHRGARCHVVGATPAAPMSGWRLTPRCEEPKGHLEKKKIHVSIVCLGVPFSNTVTGHAKVLWISFKFKTCQANHPFTPGCNQTFIMVSTWENLCFF